MSEPFRFKGGSYPGTGGTCSERLAPSGTCTITVTFSPSSTGVASSTLSVTYDDGMTMQSANRGLQGTGQTPAVLSISDGATFNFGEVIVGASAMDSLVITNSGGFPASPMTGALNPGEFKFAGGTYPGTGGTCGASLASSASCSVVIAFTPKTAMRSNTTLSLDYHDGVTAQSATRPLTGVGL